MALDSPGELGADPEAAARYREQLLDGATSADITIPDEVPEPQGERHLPNLAFEMRLAQSTVNGTYAAVGFHVTTRTPSTLTSTRGSNRDHLRKWSPQPV